MCGLKVLSVGLSESAMLMRDALLLHPGSHLCIATGYRDLCALSLQHHKQFHVAVLDVSASARELRRRAQYIRRTWPDAAIVLLGGNSEVLKHRLYDKRVSCRVGPADLLAVIDRLTPGVEVEPAA